VLVNRFSSFCSERFGQMEKERDNLRSQFVTSSDHGGRRYRPYAFTEQGVAMLSGMLKSKRAIQVNVEIIRTFVRLRQMLSTHKDLARKIIDLESKYDGKFRMVFEALRPLMEPPPEKPKPRIGFVSKGKRVKK
nr:ORF6N domain-containing protein [Chthoniobacterales bacterium]